MTECAVFAAVICIFSPLTVPLGVVPVTMGLFAVMLAGVVLDAKQSMISVLVFVLIGLCGIPVFSGARAGVGVFFGPTGGYIWSYFICAPVISLICRMKTKNKVFRSFAACTLGMVFCYVLGTVQYVVFSQNIAFSDALKVCVYPFVPFDMLKGACAAFLGETIKKRLR